MSSSKFPKLVRGKQTGEAGVNAVSTIVNDKLKWIFRRVNLEHDFGIDGYMDIVEENGSVTGQSIAVQIKAGQSFFTTKTATGFTYYGEDKHLNYYLNLPMPLLLVLYDPGKHRCYWTQFDVRRTERARSGWKITVAKNSILSEASKAELLAMVGPAVDHHDAIRAHWALNETLQKADFVLYAVPRDNIETGNVGPVAGFIERIIHNDTLCRKLQGRIIIEIDGYNEDPREIFEIPEVVQWYEKADPVFKYWFYFLSPEFPSTEFPSLLTYWTCMCSGKRMNRKPKRNWAWVEMDADRMLSVLERNLMRLNELTDRLGLSEEQNRRISCAVMDQVKIWFGK
jgi:hypothetical protein